MDRNVIYLEQTDSTNEEIRRRAKGTKEGLVVVADRQTKGKGRRGRTWISEEGNLYMSILLRPQISPDRASVLTLVMAYSITEVFRKEEIPVWIKWPNDIILADKKVCGILTEMHMEEKGEFLVISGVGINLDQTAFPEELQEQATSIFLETGKEMKREVLVEEILNQFEKNYNLFLEREDLTFLQDSYNAYLINCGKEVRVLEPSGEYQGVAKGINKEGELLVEKENGEEMKVFAGEVSVRGLFGYV